jgi:hypothetical protein
MKSQVGESCLFEYLQVTSAETDAKQKCLTRLLTNLEVTVFVKLRLPAFRFSASVSAN